MTNPPEALPLMRRLLAILPFLAASLFAQNWSDPNIRAMLADGRELVFPVVTGHDVPVIVEFRDAPLALVNARSAKAAMGNYQATFSRFRNDAAAIMSARVSGKTALSAPEIKREYFEAFNGVALTVPREALPALRALPYVKKVHLDKEMHASAIAVPVNVSTIKADRVWNELGTKGRGIVVAIIDTGIDYRHPALGGCLGAGCRVIGGHDFVNNDDDPMDDHFHGTHVAGIVGGNSDEISGVAPEVSFLAYKVLNSHGSGSESNVIAAIERAVDPNGDGDLRDHADVVNLSLGGFGNADDAASTAIDNATAAGTVFAVAAGNAGVGHSIDSPGTARQAITVGASDNTDRIASFSSRGPSPKLISIKPDVVAPGVSIRSSLPNGQYGNLSGTSMATPHVAGTVALIRALHHDWTPAQIKTQLMNTSASIGEEIMVQGAGRIDAFTASTGAVGVDPPSLSLGLDPIGQAAWSATATVHVTNRGTDPVSYSVVPQPTAGVAVTSSATSLSLAAGQSGDLTFTFNVNNGSVKPSDGTFSVGGFVTLNPTGVGGALRIPWGSVKAARALVTYEHNLISALWVDEVAGTLTMATPISDTGDNEIILTPGTYDLLLYSADVSPDTFRTTDARVFFLPAQQLNGDTRINLTSADAPYTVTFDARNENGQPIVGSDLAGYASSGRLIFPAASKVKSLQLPPIAIRSWHVNAMGGGATLLPHELYYDALHGRMYVVPQRPLSGLTGDVTLSGGGASLRRGDVSVFSAPSKFGDRRVLLTVIPFAPVGSATGIVSLSVANLPPSVFFNNTLFLGPDTLSGFSFGITYAPITDGSAAFTTPSLRVVNDKISSVSPVLTPPWTYGGTTFVYGAGLVYPLQTFSQSVLANHPGIFTDFAGELNELRTSDRFQVNTSLFKGDGTVLASGARYPQSLDLSVPGAYRIEAVHNTMSLFPGVPRTAMVTMNLDSSRSDYFPPVFTAMMLFDGAGRLATRLEPNGGGSVQFAAADYSYVGLSGSVTRTYHPVRAEATKAWYRVTGPGEWLPLTVTQVMEDSGQGSVVSSGILFRADLAALTQISGARQLYDLKFDIQDTAGNSTSYQLMPAFSVGPEAPARRRTAGK
jgi:subtilisin family serine protease